MRRLIVSVILLASVSGCHEGSIPFAGDIATTQGAAAGTGGAGGAAGGKSNQCESRADKRHLAGDQRDSYIKRCMASTNKSHKRAAKPGSAAMQGGAGSQTQQGGSTSSQ